MFMMAEIERNLFMSCHSKCHTLKINNLVKHDQLYVSILQTHWHPFLH